LEKFISPNQGLGKPACTEGGEPDAGIAFNNDAQPESGSEALNSGLAGGNKQLRHPQRRFPLAGTSDRQN